MLAYTLATSGDVTYFVILTWAAARAASPTWSGFILAAGAVPRAILLLPGGVLADRVSPRRVAIVTDGVRCVVMVAAAGLAAVLGLLPWWLTMVAVVFGIVDACFMPAVGALPARLVSSGNLKRMQAWRIAGLRVSNTLGPLVGAVLITAGMPAAFCAVAAMFAVSVALLVTVQLRPTDTNSTGQTRPTTPHIRATMSRLRANRLGRLVIGTALSEIPFSGPVAVGIVLMIQERGWPPTAVGAILAAFSIGGLATTLILTVLPDRALGKSTVVTSTAGSAVLLVVLVMMPSTLTASTVGAVLGLTTGITMTACHGQIQQSTPVDLLGRVTALLSLFTLGLSPLLYAVTGAISGTLGAVPFFYAAGGVALLAAAVLATAHFGSIDSNRANLDTHAPSRQRHHTSLRRWGPPPQQQRSAHGSPS